MNLPLEFYLAAAALGFACGVLIKIAGDAIPIIEQIKRDRELARLDEIDRERGSLGAFDRFEADLEDGSPNPFLS